MITVEYDNEIEGLQGFQNLVANFGEYLGGALSRSLGSIALRGEDVYRDHMMSDVYMTPPSPRYERTTSYLRGGHAANPDDDLSEDHDLAYNQRRDLSARENGRESQDLVKYDAGSGDFTTLVVNAVEYAHWVEQGNEYMSPRESMHSMGLQMEGEMPDLLADEIEKELRLMRVGP